MTGAGLGDCKKALAESNGNINEAIEIIRKKGQLLLQSVQTVKLQKVQYS